MHRQRVVWLEGWRNNWNEGCLNDNDAWNEGCLERLVSWCFEPSQPQRMTSGLRCLGEWMLEVRGAQVGMRCGVLRARGARGMLEMRVLGWGAAGILRWRGS